ncbi:hypothetical protein BH10BAC1_BH10BAC1_09700 [soil metagenome]
MSTTIASKMERIQTIFHDSQELVSQNKSITELVTHLETTDKDFLPVAFEAAAMAMALKDFSSGDAILNWQTLLNSSKKFACQIYLGMGWAVAREKRNIISFIDELNRNMQFRIWDGCGYFDGVFRQRQTVKGQKRLEHIQAKDYQAYDEGLGRSLWYICKGDEKKLEELLQQFAPDRHADLWRGIGIACSFVGGFEEAALKNLLLIAGHHSIQLGIGAAMVAKSRIESDCKTEDIELACTIFCNLNAQEAMNITVKNKSVPNFSFSTFILQMEKDILQHRK